MCIQLKCDCMGYNGIHLLNFLNVYLLLAAINKDLYTLVLIQFYVCCIHMIEKSETVLYNNRTASYKTKFKVS